MKKIILILFVSFITLDAYCQISHSQINSLVKTLKTGGRTDDEIKNAVNGVIKNPDLYNNLWKNFIEQAYKKDSSWSFLKDLNIQFKTFQATDNAPTGLGFTYDFSFDYAKFTESTNHKHRVSQSFGLQTKGNVAFNKNINPTDFLESKVNYSISNFSGGIVITHDTIITKQIYAIVGILVNINDMQSIEAIKLWEELGNNLVLTNQYYYSLSPKIALESNQDFSKKQFTPGVTLDLGVKAWNKKAVWSKLNVLDYPFALIRVILGADKRFTPYGSTLPTAQIAFDYVIPSNDTTREALTGNLNPFPRIKFETGFRTLITRIKKENIFFNANYRYYQEINAPETVTKANLATHSYFVMALQSTSGFYVSYANGKLPFDAKSDEVYSIGFNYKFN